MMKKLTIVAALVALAALSACDKQAEVKQFVSDLSAAVAAGDKSAVARLYPDAARADSLAIAFKADGAQIEELEGGGWRVVLGEGKDLVLAREGSGTLTVKESHGVFVFPSAARDFALKTGLANDGITDLQMATQLADTAFVAWVVAEFMREFKKKFRITGDYFESSGSDGTGGGWQYITVKNDCDYDIAGSDYQITIASKAIKGKAIVLEGKDLFAGATAQFTGDIDEKFAVRFDEDGCWKTFEPKSSLTINLSDAELLGKYFNPKGDEYDNYLKTKAK